jgi:signal transduction histidine kinase
MYSEQQLHTALQNTADAILQFDTQTRLSPLNLAGQRLFIDSEAKPGQSSAYDSLLQLLDQARRSNTSFSKEVEWPDKRVFSASITPDQEGGCLVALHDVSRFKEIEKNKNEYIAAAAHDLRTPLTSIIGFSHLIKRAGPLTEAQRDFVQRIEHATANMSELVDNMLNLAKLDLGAEPSKDEVSLLRMLWDVADEFQPQAEVRRHLLMIATIGPETKVLGNAWQLRQVLHNLVENAIKYTPDGGAITLSLEQEANIAKIQIKDTGYGIPSSDLPHIFDRFYRVRSNGHEDIEGNGLGLAIVKTIVEKHGGQVTVESEVGKGSCFTVHVPLLQQERLLGSQMREVHS